MTAATTEVDLSAEAIERVLEARAAQLAQSVAQSDRDHHLRPYLRFALGDARFAIDATEARRILEPRWITRVPGAPPELPWVLQTDGQVLSVLDLRSLLGSADGGTRERQRVLLLGRHAGFGVAIDDVLDLAAWDSRDIRPVDGDERLPFVEGRGPDLTVLLSVSALRSTIQRRVGPRR